MQPFTPSPGPAPEPDGILFATLSFHMHSTNISPFAQLEFTITQRPCGDYIVECQPLRIMANPRPEWNLDGIDLGKAIIGKYAENPLEHAHVRDAALNLIATIGTAPFLQAIRPYNDRVVMLARSFGPTATMQLHRPPQSAKAA